MKIYEIQSNYWEGCTDWVESVGLYLDEVKAEYYCALLQEQEPQKLKYYNVYIRDVNEEVTL